MLGVLVQIFGGNAVSTDCGLAREPDVTDEYLLRAAPDLDIRTVAVKGLIVLRNSRLLLDRPVCAGATARSVIWS
jgi:hypothetical protein